MSVPSPWVRKVLERLGGRQRSNPIKRSKGLGVELLEGRDLPSTITLTSGVLTYDAGSGINNNFSVTVSGTDFVFNDTAETITTSISGATGSGTNTVTVPFSGVTGLTLNLG